MPLQAAWPARLALALLATASASNAAAAFEPEEQLPAHSAQNSTSVAPQGSSRTILSGEGLLIQIYVPDWLVLMFGAEECSELDSYFCGMGVRLKDGYFIAHSLAASKVAATLAKSRNPKGPPGLFKFKAPHRFEADQENDDDYLWAPELVKTYAENIALYRPNIREAIGKYGLRVKNAYPDASPPLHDADDCVSFWRAKPPEKCKVLVYGNHQIKANHTRFFAHVEVRIVSCKGQFVKTGEYCRGNSFDGLDICRYTKQIMKDVADNIKKDKAALWRPFSLGLG